MGKLAMRAGWNQPGYEIVHVNDPAITPSCLAHLLEFDSVHGRWHQHIEAVDNAITINHRPVSISKASAIESVAWEQAGVEVLIECSGRFKTADDLAPYFDAGVRKVLVSAPCLDPALNLVMGVNHHLYDPGRHHIVTAASCTTNCLAPLVSVMHKHLGIVRGSMTTIHCLTNTQDDTGSPP